ncbi:MAG TPA: MYG1 family protein, partial [Solirubrobacteraceae bacterium]|nr:MYG1 family protein [Solirubrobacteraceae bacterium]
VATHPGNFHADEVFALAVLQLVHGELEVVRTRDPEAQAAADLRVDVGGRHDPATGDFDHHQKGGAGERENGIRYASLGLVWLEHGEALAGSAEAAAAIDDRLVAGVDANDVGQTLIEPLVGDIRPMSVSGVIAALNPAWDKALSPAEEDARFAQAVDLARGMLERELEGAAAFGRARALVAAAIRRAGDPRVIELDSNMPWREAVIAHAPEALYVVYPKTDGWGSQAVPREVGSFENRLSFPADWRGRSGEDLAAATGVRDAIFCHAAGFYASAGSRDGIVALVAASIAAAE